MGYSRWSHEVSESLYSSRSAMPMHAYVASTFTKESIDPKMDPINLKVRESRDSDTHPESNAIAVLFDVTGSMGSIPVKLSKEKLGGLMKMLLGQNAIPHPQILFGAIGDATCDLSSLQVGQFESGLEMDDQLVSVHIEHGGGGGNHESYQNGIYVLSRKTAIDCFEKRGKKGYAFIIGDEHSYLEVDRHEIKRLIGDDLQENITLKDIIEECQQKYHLFRISVHSPSYDTGGHEWWQKYLNQYALFLDDPDMVCELIASQIAAMEGMSSAAIESGLASAGLNTKALSVISDTIVHGSPAMATKTGTIEGDLVIPGTSSKTVRL